MAALDFFINPNAGNEFNLDLSGSGIGFYGANFGNSVSVGAYNSTVFATDANGVVQGAQGWSCTYVHPNSGTINYTGSGLALSTIPNYQSQLNIRFTHTDAVQVRNCLFYAYDGSSINNAPSGVTVKAAEIIHPGTAQTATGSGDTTWVTLAGSGSTLTLANSPGPSGIFAGDGSSSNYQNIQHDWYVLLSVSPNSVGSKTFKFYVSYEYL